MSVSARAVDRRAALGGVVGVEIAGRAGHFDPPPADQRRQPAQQVDRRDHRAALAVHARQTAAARGVRPWPHSQTFVAGSLPCLRGARRSPDGRRNSATLSLISWLSTSLPGPRG